MTLEERANRLKKLNQICIKCRDDAAKRFDQIAPKSCMYCKIGIEIHKLETPEWDSIDWNSAKWEELYRH